MVRVVTAFVVAVLATYVVGVVSISQVNLASIAALGMDIQISHRIDAMVHDLTHMYDIYLILLIIGELIAFGVAAFIIKYAPNLRLLGYVLAGFVGLIAIHLLLKMTFGVSGIAATRSTMGLLMQGIAGAIGGYLFHRLSLRKESAA